MPYNYKKKENGKNATGAPSKYNSPEEMQAVIDEWIAKSSGKILEDADGNPVLYKGEPVYIDRYPLTVTGLALALGFNSRQSLLNYNADPRFTEVITKAKSYVEQYVESRLFDKDGCNGAKFSLTNSFRGWKEKQEIEMTEHKIKVTIED